MKHPLVVLSLCNALILPQFTASTLYAGQNATVTDPAQAADTGTDSDNVLAPIVVTANRYETPIDEVGSAITVITSKEIEQSKKTTVLEVLRSVPALDVVQNGGAGGLTYVFMRGAKSEHTLVLLDGVEMNDPASTGGSFDFASLSTDNVERIEILRGPQSTLYGSQAMGGVINIITKRGKGKLKGFFSAEGGSYYTAQEKAGISGGSDVINYSLGVSRFDTGGFSAADSRLGNSEHDGYQRTALNSRFGITPSKNLNIDLMLNYLRSRSDMDIGGGTNLDDSNYYQRSEQITFRTQADLSLFDEFWIQKLGVSFNDLNRGTNNGFDAAHPSDMEKSNYHGQSVKVDWQHLLNLHKTNTLTFGLERKEENAKSDYYSESIWGPYSSVWNERHASNTGGYIQDRISLWDRWFTTLGVRVDSHSRFGKEATYRFTSAYTVKQTGTTFKGSYGTGFKAPSLYQLYSDYGNANLKPEKSTGWDAGFEQNVAALNTSFGATFFYNDFKEMIDYDSALSKYENISKARTRGVEVAVTVKPITDLTLQVTYTYTKTKDVSTGLELLRRPKNKFGFNANYTFMKNANMNVNVIYVGTRADSYYSGWTPTRTKMKDYVVVNLAASYDINKNFQIFGKIDNLLNRYYEDIYGYGTSRLAAYGGVKISF